MWQNKLQEGDERGCIIQGDESCKMPSRRIFLGFPQTQNWPTIFIAFQGHLSQQTKGPIKEVTQLLDGWEFAGAAGICCLRTEWVSSRASCWNKKGLRNRRQKMWPPKTWRKSKLLLYLFFCYCSCIRWTVQGTNNAWGGWCSPWVEKHVESKEFCYITWYLKSYFMQFCLPCHHPAAQTFFFPSSVMLN